MIPGITDRPRLPRLAKIRLGEKRQSAGGKEYPAALDHFSFVDAPELQELFGDNAREIHPILLPAEEEETWFSTGRTAYTKSGLFCRCNDGETAVRVHKGLDEKTKKPLDPQGYAFLESIGFVDANGSKVETGDMFEMPCPGEECPYFSRGYCKNLGRLFFFVLESPKFGLYEIATSSINSIRNVLSSARAIQKMAGRLTGIPLALRLIPMQVQPEGRAKTVFVLQLEFRDGGLRQLMAIARRPLLGIGNAKLLGAPEPVPVTDVPDDLFPRAGESLDEHLSQAAQPDPSTTPAQPAAPPSTPAPARRRAPRPLSDRITNTSATVAPTPKVEEPPLNDPDDFFGPEPSELAARAAAATTPAPPKLGFLDV